MRAAIYPYNYDTKTITSHCSDMKGFELKNIISFRDHESYIKNRLGGIIDGINIDSDFEKAIANVECVIFTDNLSNAPLETYAKRIRQAAEMQKKVILDQNLYFHLTENKLLGSLKEVSYNIMTSEFNWNSISEFSMKKINIPIITIYGMVESCSKFDIHLRLAHWLEQMGIKALHISANSCGYLFGMKPMPRFMFDSNISFERKIFMLNRFVFEQINESKPQVVVITAPGGVTAYSQTLSNHYGELAAVVGNAITADAGILCLGYTNKIDSPYLSYIHNFLEYRLNSDIFAYCISNIKTKEDLNTHNFERMQLDAEEMEYANLNTLKENVAYLTDNKGVEKILKKLIGYLADNIDAI